MAAPRRSTSRRARWRSTSPRRRPSFWSTACRSDLRTRARRHGAAALHGQAIAQRVSSPIVVFESRACGSRRHTEWHRKVTSMSWFLRLSPILLLSACGGTTLTHDGDGSGGNGNAGNGGDSGGSGGDSGGNGGAVESGGSGGDGGGASGGKVGTGGTSSG